MKTVLVGLIGAFILMPAGAIACNLPVLRDSVDRIKGGPEPYAGTIAFACVDILKDPNNVKSRAAFYTTFRAAMSNNPAALSSLDGCSAEEIRSAC